MKNVIFIFCLLFSIFIKAQDYTPLLDNRNEWHLISCYLGDCIRDVYQTDGDTIVGGQTHKILDGYHYISRTFLLREDVNEKKVYLKTIINHQIEDYLLYDFSLEEGDIINMYNPITPFPEDGGEFRLDSIRVEPVLGEQTGRFYYFSPTPDNVQSAEYFPVWVEGLGSLSIVTAPGGHPDYNGVGKVSCFFKNNALFYFDDEMTEECNSVMSIYSEQGNYLQLQFAIKSKSEGILKSNTFLNKVEIYDFSGKKMLQQMLTDKKINEINLNDLNKGSYILVAYGNHNKQSISFILK